MSLKVNGPNNSLDDTNGNELLIVSATGSAVNEFTVVNAATGNRPRLQASGGDTNVSVALRPKGSTGTTVIEDSSGNEVIIAAAGTASAVNELTATNAATGNAPSLAATGGDTNIDLQLSAKGTGSVALGDSGTASATAGAATLNTTRGVITSEALTTAAGADYTLTLTNSKVAATDIVFATVQQGTNTTEGLSVQRITPGSGSVVILVRNTHASSALNGTIKVGFWVLPG